MTRILYRALRIKHRKRLVRFKLDQADLVKPGEIFAVAGYGAETKRFRCLGRSTFIPMDLPLPAPAIKIEGAFNLWDILL